MSQEVSKSYLRHPTTTSKSTDSDFFIHETDFFALVVLCYRNVNKQTKVCENNSGIIHSGFVVGYHKQDNRAKA